MPFLDQFDAVLLDMGDTFMFGLDNFSPDQDYLQTYRDLGGRTLSAADIGSIIQSGFDRLSAEYKNPALFDRFPASIDSLIAAAPEFELKESEWKLLDAVFAGHECGTIPQSHANAVKALAKTHTLGLVSNIWAPSAACRSELKRAGILDLFHSIVYSSDWQIVKPAAKLFEIALAEFDVPRSRTLFVGDSLQRDVAGARAVGLSTVWIQTDRPDGSLDDVFPDRIISDLRELPHV